ncbi:MAG: response regulator transcription factor [Dongiaceae bacterium]
MRVVLIDEEIVAAEALKAGLSRNGIACDAVDYELDDLVEAAAQGCEAVVITVPHSKIEVVRFIETLRHRRIGVPVLVLQSFRNSAQAIELINAGADDVLAKPVNLAELAARLRGIARRINGHVTLSHNVGNFTYYFDGRMPMISGKTVKVSRRERELLECLVLRQNRIVNRRFIYNYIYGYNSSAVDEKTVDVMMCKVRKKLRAFSGGEDYIQTFPGQGYRFADPERVRREGRFVVVAYEAQDGDEPAAAESIAA